MIRNRKSWNACVRVCDTKCVFLFLHLSFGRLPPSPADFIISHLGSAHFNSQNCVRLAQIFQIKWTTENGWCGGWNCCRLLLVKRWQQFEEKHITIFRFHIICRNELQNHIRKKEILLSAWIVTSSSENIKTHTYDTQPYLWEAMASKTESLKSTRVNT